MKTIIANPIYDSVFKFLMEDPESACTLLSHLLQREVLEVQMKNNEYTKVLEDNISVLRIDFSARVRDVKGNIENVNIELQKAWLTSEIVRFRKYIAQQYADANNRYIISDYPLVEKPLHIVTIFLLGHEVAHLENAVTYVYPKMFDQHGQPITTDIREVDFVNELVHDAIIVQIPKISKTPIATKLDQLLSIFDQEFQVSHNNHQLEIEENNYESGQKCIVNRLIRAVASPKVNKEMDIEDEFSKVIDGWEQEKLIYDERIAEKENEIAEKENLLQEKDSLIKEMAIMLIKAGGSKEEISKKLGVNVQSIEEWTGTYFSHDSSGHK